MELAFLVRIEPMFSFQIDHTFTFNVAVVILFLYTKIPDETELIPKEFGITCK
jgi:hypothetical protein